MPLQVDPTTQEPYLELPSPHSNIRLTPPNIFDVPAAVSLQNDPLIYRHLAGTPLPYKTEHVC